MALLEFQKVAIERGGRLLLEEVDLQIVPGEKLAVVGPSGSGKTSLLMVAMGVFAPSRGRILFDGQEIAPDNIGAIRSQIAFITQEPIMGAELVQNALLLPFSYKANRSRQPTRARIFDTLERLHLNHDILNGRSAEISAGEKQRIAIARALLLDKNVFLVDEATSALDLDSKAAVAEMLAEPAFTILSVSHDQYWIDRCQRVLRVDSGRLARDVG